MICKRIIPCLDIDNGRVVKGVNFGQLRDVGDPVDLARFYQDEGADELVFLDISATIEDRQTVFDVVQRVAGVLMIPFTVGGGVGSIGQVKRLLECGADKVTVNTAAVANPELIAEIASECGSQCCVLAVDARQCGGGHCWEVLTHGGRRQTGIDATTWCIRAVERGAGEILLTSWDRDGTLSGFDLELTATISAAVSVPVIASGGAGGADDFVSVLTTGMADAALAASIFHDHRWTVAELKRVLAKEGVPVRL
ncbi:MAG: imidazole glycerol phosphate synthase subunit HisF [candidate division Zixibacteria bacterium]|nr:imidazole glycerol phosphate synthase subunit HisF [candidate division Zixibacteria bacterium]